MKGTVISNFANVKPVDGVPSTTGIAMQIGDYVFGTLSPTGSDLMGFTYFFRSNGVKVPLNEPCKASAANMKLTNETEPGGPPPDPDPVPTPDPDSVVEIIDSVVTWKAADGTIRTTRLIPE